MATLATFGAATAAPSWVSEGVADWTRRSAAVGEDGIEGAVAKAKARHHAQPFQLSSSQRPAAPAAHRAAPTAPNS